MTEAAEDLDLAGDLLAELPRRYDDQCERGAGASLDALEDREGEGAGLAGAGLRLREEIATRAKRWYRELLNGCERGPTELLHSAVEIGGKRDQLISFAGQQKSEPKCDSARCSPTRPPAIS